MAFNWQTDFYRYRRYFTDVKRFYRQKKVRVYTEIILSLLAIAFFLFFAIKPTLITITGLIKEIKDKKMITQRLEEKINNLNLAQKEYFATQDDFYLIDQALPKDPQISVLIKQFEILASKNGVSLEGIQYSSLDIKNKIVSTNYQTVDFKMAVSGDYQSLKNFLSSLSNFRRLFRVKGFGFKTSKKEGQLSLSIDGETFFLGGEK